jgi:ATP-binding cassette subfamily B protein
VSTFLTPVIILFEVFLEVLVPTAMAYIVDVAGAVATGTYVSGLPQYEMWDNILARFPALTQGTTLLWVLGAICVVMVGFSLTCGIMAGRTSAKAGAGFASNLRRALFVKVQGFSFANIDKFSTAGLVTRCTTDVNNAQMSFQQLIRIVIRAPFMMVMATVMALRLSADVAWVFFILIPMLAILMAVTSFFAFPRFKKMLKLYDNMNNDVQENLVAVRVVKAFNREDHEDKKYSMTADLVRRAQLSAEKLMVVAMPASTLIMFSSTIIVAILGGNKIIAGTLKSGSFTALISYSTQVLMSVMMVCFIIIQLVLSRASINRINEALDEVPDIADGDCDKTVNSGSIVFDHVNFSYSKNADNLTLTDINLDIRSGETIGIVGGTGEGKSSIVQLIPRFYDVFSGKILVDGTDVRDYKIKTLRDGVAMVLQKNVLFSGTIEENLRWGNEGATVGEIEEACRAACAHDFVMSFEDGYQTELGQGGVNVSGGQKQRLCIARALLKKPKIMIMDDSTSAVDTHTDATIRTELKKHFGDMTVLIIAQRIASIVNCDRIVVVDEGKISAVGTHEQLLNTSEIYQEVYHSQQKGEADSGSEGGQE